MAKKQKKAWGGRFEDSSNPLLDSFNASLSFDRRLYAEDIEGSMAHSRMLHKIGILKKSEMQKIHKALQSILKEIESEKFNWNESHEDIHMAVEARLIEKIGSLGGKLHTARSRNDQVATDLRLYCRKEVEDLIMTINLLQEVLVLLAEKKGLIPMPAYTHLQRAQPVYWAHHLLAYFEMFQRDKERFEDSLKRIAVLPLGSGALSGSPYPLDRKMVAEELGFPEISHNSLDAVSDRDFVAEILFNISLLMAHFSRLSEELILWTSQEFAFVELPQSFCTGSSMMPQKVNPDVPELIRGKSGRVYGNLMSLLTVMKGLPLAYNKDLQEDKEPLFDSLDTVFDILFILIAMLPQMNPRKDKMREATKEGFLLATDLADYLVYKGLPFRKAHEVVGQAVQSCISQGKALEDCSLEELKAFSSKIQKDVFEWLDLEKAMNRRAIVGGTALKQVKKEIKRAKKLITPPHH